MCHSYLNCKHGHSADPHPAVQRVQVSDVEVAVEVEHSVQAQAGQEQRQQHEAGVHQLPGEFLLPPGERHTMHNSCCRDTDREERRLKETK